MTVGKLYGGILIYDNWKKTKFGQIEVLRQQEQELLEAERAAKEEDRARRIQECIDAGGDPNELVFTDDEDEEENRDLERRRNSDNREFDDEDYEGTYPHDEDDGYGRDGRR